jgi:hypothetical protein
MLEPLIEAVHGGSKFIDHGREILFAPWPAFHCCVLGLDRIIAAEGSAEKQRTANGDHGER